MKTKLALCYLAGAASAVVTIHFVGRRIHRKQMEKLHDLAEAFAAWEAEQYYRQFREEAKSN